MAVHDQWLAPTWPVGPAQALTTTRQGGVSTGAYASLNLAAHVGDGDAAVARNREVLAASIRVEQIQWLEQVHGTRVVRVDTKMASIAPQADAAWTTRAGLALAVLTADCVPVVFSHCNGGAIAVAHAGWRGLVAGVLANLLRALPDDPDKYLTWIGPAIGVDAYQVGEEVADAVIGMANVGRLAEDCLHDSHGPSEKYQLDLAGLAAMQLDYLGVAGVWCERICTFADSRFFSYRRDGTTGRMATLVWLSPSH
ncbi:MAG: peptidoglycan editing factor PgeF [Gammaproteobacteria bacterium]|nr:peptidoglycan editing factor PgeF [Gammaproteobacteria bacterium]